MRRCDEALWPCFCECQREKALGEDHKRFDRRFGKLHVHPLQAMKEGDRERLEVSAGKSSKFVNEAVTAPPVKGKAMLVETAVTFFWPDSGAGSPEWPPDFTK